MRLPEDAGYWYIWRNLPDYSRDWIRREMRFRLRGSKWLADTLTESYEFYYEECLLHARELREETEALKP
jgi:hypothetical protein